ncbi:MAG: hypothetical protein WCV56_03845 [Candidatus Omnitrophota bacterium]
MVKTVKVLALALGILAVSSAAEATTVELISEGGGVYEDGKFTSGGDLFHGVYSVREDDNRIVLEEVISSDREGRVEEGLSYEMVNSMKGEGFSTITVSAERKGQKIYTAVREGHLGSFEVLVVGEDFYEYSNVSAGRFYLESGRVEKRNP